jgi:hypothetical protein
MDNERKYIITVYFVSGKSLDIAAGGDYLNDWVESLKKGWSDLKIIDKIYGFNLYHVTHYEVSEK